MNREDLKRMFSETGNIVADEWHELPDDEKVYIVNMLTEMADVVAQSMLTRLRNHGQDPSASSG